MEDDEFFNSDDEPPATSENVEKFRNQQHRIFSIPDGSVYRGWAVRIQRSAQTKILTYIVVLLQILCPLFVLLDTNRDGKKVVLQLTFANTTASFQSEVGRKQQVQLEVKSLAIAFMLLIILSNDRKLLRKDLQASQLRRLFPEEEDTWMSYRVWMFLDALCKSWSCLLTNLALVPLFLRHNLKANQLILDAIGLVFLMSLDNYSQDVEYGFDSDDFDQLCETRLEERKMQALTTINTRVRATTKRKFDNQYTPREGKVAEVVDRPEKGVWIEWDTTHEREFQATEPLTYPSSVGEAFEIIEEEGEPSTRRLRTANKKEDGDCLHGDIVYQIARTLGFLAGCMMVPVFVMFNLVPCGVLEGKVDKDGKVFEQSAEIADLPVCQTSRVPTTLFGQLFEFENARIWLPTAVALWALATGVQAFHFFGFRCCRRHYTDHFVERTPKSFFYNVLLFRPDPDEDASLRKSNY
jgi:hypothetical protein